MVLCCSLGRVVVLGQRVVVRTLAQLGVWCSTSQARTQMGTCLCKERCCLRGEAPCGPGPMQAFPHHCPSPGCGPTPGMPGTPIVPVSVGDAACATSVWSEAWPCFCLSGHQSGAGAGGWEAGVVRVRRQERSQVLGLRSRLPGQFSALWGQGPLHL